MNILLLFLLLLVVPEISNAGKLQNEDFKTESELIIAGGAKSQLLNDTKIYVTAIAKTLDDAIADGDIGRELTAKGNLFGFGTSTQECILDKTDGKLLTVDSTATCGFDFKDAPVSTTLTTKGELQGFSTSNVAVGPCIDDQILLYDSVEASGWRCATSALVAERCQRKELSSDLTSNTTDITDLRFNNLTIGNRYKVISRPYFALANADNIQFDVAFGTSSICRTVMGGTTGVKFTSTTCSFTATATTLNANLLNMDAGNQVRGNGSIGETHVTLCTDNTEDTLEWN